MAYLRIVRPINLLLLLLTQWLIKFGFFETLGVQVAMNTSHFVLLVVATLCIAAAGNIINDIHDITIDTINKPKKVIVGKKISEKAAFNAYLTLNIIGVGAGFFLANQLGHPGLAAVFIIISVLLYSYATYLKSVLLLGNIVVSILVASSLLVLIIFDVYPAINTDLMELQIEASKTILWYAACAFYINLIREIVKDIQDVNGDKNGGRTTLPIALGRARATNIVFGMGALALLAVLWYAYIYLYDDSIMAFYFVFILGGPLLFFSIRAWSAKNAKDYTLLSWTLKIVMLVGVCSLLFFTEILMPL